MSLISVTFNVFYLFPFDVSNPISNLFEERANADGDGVNKDIALPPRPLTRTWAKSFKTLLQSLARQVHLRTRLSLEQI